MMAAPSSPMFCRKSSALTPSVAGNMSSELRRKSLVSDHDDMILLREKLTRIAVGRHHVGEMQGMQQENEERRRGCRTGALNTHFKVCSLLSAERPSTPPSSPQPRDVLRKQLQVKQQTRRPRLGSVGDKGIVVSIEDVEVTAMEDVEESHAVHSPPPVRGYRRRPHDARLSLPGQLRIVSSFSLLTKYPEGLRKRKSVHTADGMDDQRASLKKTASQINLRGATTDLSRSSSASEERYQTFAANKKVEKDQEMDNASQLPQNARFASNNGHLSACS